MAEAGFFTIIHYAERQEGAQLTLEKIRSAGGDGALIKANFMNPTGVAELFEQVDQILGSRSVTAFDVLVNNAGMGWIQEFEEMNANEFDELISVNVKAPFFVTQNALKRIRDGGRIINLTSIVTRMAMPAVPAYSMTKAALDSMTLWLAKQLGPRQITVNSVAPGIVNTEMNAVSLGDPASHKAMASLSVFNRVGEPSDIADVVAFLVSHEGRWISGQRIEASGGSYL
ncbi:3-oxoacyl-[acyl-carrier-protein] reductase FabG [compost metagenome]